MDVQKPAERTLIVGSNQAYLDVRRSLLQRLWSLQCQLEHTRFIAQRYEMGIVVEAIDEAMRPLAYYFSEYGKSVMESDEGMKEMKYWIDRRAEWPRMLW